MITFHATRVLCYSLLCTSITGNKLPQYTYRVFNWVIEELCEDGLLYISNVMSDIDCRVYDIKKFKYGNWSWRVFFHESDSRVVCTYNLMQTLGIPCNHSFTIMKAEPIRDTYMYDFVAWTTYAKIPKSYLQISSSNLSMSEIVHIGSLTITCRNLIHFVAKTVDGYNNIIKVIHELTLWAQDALGTNVIPRHSIKTTHRGDVIQNLLVVKSKGSFKTTFTKKQRVCSVCHQSSHIK